MRNYRRSVSPPAPIFIFASGWRSGSTLLQRLVSSHPAIHIWGENRGLCLDLERIYVETMRLQPISASASEEFLRVGDRAWIAMLNPPPDGLLRGLELFLERYFGEPVRRLGKTRWGFKEVRHGMSMVRFLRRVYPEAKFLLLVRDPYDCLASARATAVPNLTAGLLAEIGEPSLFLGHWAAIASSFLESQRDSSHESPTLVLRYEDLIGQPQQAVSRIARFLGERPEAFQLAVFDIRRRGWLEEEPRLIDIDRAALTNASLWEVAGRFGYSPRDPG